MTHPALTVLEGMAVPALTAWVAENLAKEQVRWIAGSTMAREFALVDLDGRVLMVVWIDAEDFEIISPKLEALTV